MNKSLTISQLSKEVGLPAKTIRFYEEKGVIAMPAREENGYRKYTSTEVEELKLIKQARDLGVPLKEIKKLIKGCEGELCEHPQEFIENKITTYISQLDAQIAQFMILKHRLQRLQTQLANQPVECTQGKYCCNILHQLSESVKEVSQDG